MLSSRFDHALIYSLNLHRDQRRLSCEVPYFSHLMAVSSLVLDNGGDENQAIAALLHDAVEDQGGPETLNQINSLFGPVVASVVSDCSEPWSEPKLPWHQRKAAFVRSLEHLPSYSLLVVLADKVHNSRTIYWAYRLHGDQVWERFNGGKQGTISFYMSLAEVLRERMPGDLSHELSSIVSQYPRVERLV